MKRKLIIFALLLVASCGGGSAATTDDGGSTTVSDISQTIPTDIVVSSPTAAITATGAVSARSLAKSEASDYETKRGELATLVAGTGECTFTAPSLQGLSNANCYGPSVDFSNHPTRVPAGGSFGGGDLGIWNENNLNSASEACAAAQMNNVVNFVAERTDTFINVMGAIACAGKKANVSLPAVGTSLDLTSSISSYVTIPNFTFSAATLERLQDSGANPVYKFSVTGTISGSAFTIILKHIPTAADNSTYKGKISFKRVTSATGQPGNCGDAGQGFAAVTGQGSVDAGTILYQKASATSVVYELNMGAFCGAITDPFNSDNNISATDTLSVSNPDGYGNGYHYGLFSLNPANGTGSVAYAWVAGLGGESTRTLNVTTMEVVDSMASGDAYFGYGPAMASSTEEDRGTITGMQCNWGSGVSVGKVEHQKLTRSANGTVFGSDSTDLNITFSPTNDCNSNGLPFTYESADGGMGNDNPSGNAVTNNLLDLDSMVFTRPTPPDDV